MTIMAKVDQWTPALACLVCQLLGIGLFSVFSYFVEPVAASFGVGLAVINTGAVFVLVAPALIGPLLGHYADVISIRKIMAVGVVMAVSALVTVSYTQNTILLAVAFALYAAGQALYGPIVTSALLIRHYPILSGRALAIAALGASIGPVILPFVVATLLDSMLWREALRWLAAAVGSVLLLAVVIGIPRSERSAQAPGETAGAGALKDVLRQPVFWLVGIAISLLFNAAMLVNISYAVHFSKLGYSLGQIATLIAAGGLAGLVAKIGAGIVLDAWRAHIRRIGAGVAALICCGFFLLANSDSYLVLLLGATLIGAGGGVSMPLHPFLNRAYFSPQIMGRVMGAQVPIFIPPSLIVAPLAGKVFDATGSFQSVFLCASAVMIVAGLMLLLLPRPAGQESADSEDNAQLAKS